MSVLMVFTNVNKIKKKAERQFELKPGEEEVKHWNTGFFLPSLCYPYKHFQKAGFEVTFASPKGGQVTPDKDSIGLWDQPICLNVFEDADVQEKLATTKRMARVDPSKFNGVYFCGGEGALLDCARDEAMNNIVTQIYDNGGVVAANSHGVVGLLNVELKTGEQLVKGRNLTTVHPTERERMLSVNDLPFNINEELAKAGANVIHGKPI